MHNGSRQARCISDLGRLPCLSAAKAEDHGHGASDALQKQNTGNLKLRVPQTS